MKNEVKNMSLQDTPEKRDTTEFYKKIGEGVYNLRKSANLSQDEFGSIFHISRVAVGNIEAGKQRLSVYHYAKICQHFNASLTDFSVGALPIAPTRNRLQRQVDRYKSEVMSSGLTDQQRQGAEMVFIGLESIIS